MLIPRAVRILFAVEPADFRNAIDGLAALVQNRLRQDPLGGQVFVFHNRSRTALKLLFWDHGGFVLVHKRLERGRFRIPKGDGATVHLTSAELGALLEGIDMRAATRLPRWNPPETVVR